MPFGGRPAQIAEMEITGFNLQQQVHHGGVAGDDHDGGRPHVDGQAQGLVLTAAGSHLQNLAGTFAADDRYGDVLVIPADGLGQWRITLMPTLSRATSHPCCFNLRLSRSRSLTESSRVGRASVNEIAWSMGSISVTNPLRRSAAARPMPAILSLRARASSGICTETSPAILLWQAST